MKTTRTQAAWSKADRLPAPVTLSAAPRSKRLKSVNQSLYSSRSTGTAWGRGMHETAAAIVFSLLLLGYGLISEFLERMSITGPMVAVSVGLVVGVAGFGFFEGRLEGGLTQILAQITLVIILFTDAARIRPRELFRFPTIPLRLLAIGMPLSVILGLFFAQLLFPILTLWPALLLAALLTPTDAALGEATVSNPSVPLYMRQSLNAESGLNDGLMLPVILAFSELARLHAEMRFPQRTIDVDQWIQFLSNQLVLGPAVGVAIGLTGSLLIGVATRHHLMAETFQRLAAPALAVLAFMAAESVHGNGFIAAFLAGLFFIGANPQVRANIESFGKAEGEQLSLLTFLLFGAFILPELLPRFDLNVLIYSILSLTVIRMLSVWIALTGSGLDWRDKIFAGWFGPRGIASLLFLIIIIDDMAFIGDFKVQETVVMTVLLSIYAHGITSGPASAWFAKHNGPPDRYPDSGLIPPLRPR